MRRLALLLTLTSLPLAAESRARKVWKWSLGALAAGAASDIASSWGKYESNPLARDSSGRFSPARGIALKSGVIAGLWIVGRKSPQVGAAANFSAAGVWAGAAISNSKVPKAKP